MNLLIVSNSSVNFLIYCVVENSFREEMIKMLLWGPRGAMGLVRRARRGR